jgi:hypothetical protein
MSKVSKGRTTENRCKKIFVEKGYLVDKKVRTRFSSPDFFGYFDLLCVKEIDTVYVQVKSNKSDFCTAKREIKKWIIENNLALKAEIWLYEGRGKWKLVKADYSQLEMKVLKRRVIYGENYFNWIEFLYDEKTQKIEYGIRDAREEDSDRAESV